MGARRLWICPQESFAAVFPILPVNGKRVTVTLPPIQSGIHRASNKPKLILSKHPREAPKGSKLWLVCESRLHNARSALWSHALTIKILPFFPYFALTSAHTTSKGANENFLIFI
jgi:hypothetical protein